MNSKKLFFILCFAILIVAIIFSISLIARIFHNMNDLSLRWTIIGALGSWVGSIFGAIALVISLFALWLPQKVKIKVEGSCAIMAKPMQDSENIEAYAITVKNIGMRAVTIRNLYLNFGGKKQKKIFVGLINQGTVLELYNTTFPKRLEAGESCNYYLHRDRLVSGLQHIEDDKSRGLKFFVGIDEVTTGLQYHKTPWTLKTFIGEKVTFLHDNRDKNYGQSYFNAPSHVLLAHTVTEYLAVSYFYIIYGLKYDSKSI